MASAVRTALVGFVLGSLLAGCAGTAQKASRQGVPQRSGPIMQDERPAGRAPRVVTLAFAGDVHFQLHLAALLDDPRGLGPMRRALAGADVAMVNLESAVTERGTLDRKELERPSERYWYRTSPDAFDFLADAGVDVVTVANNHGADYGLQGVRDTLRASRVAPLALVGIGWNRRQAFRPHLVTVHGTTLAFLAADSSPLESTAGTWVAGERSPGLAGAHAARPAALLDAVGAADARADVVVVYLHWGREEAGCPTTRQQVTARALAEAGADVVVGSHAHVLLGSGWIGETYVDYGLGNFLWYHNAHPETGVLRLRLEDGHVVSDRWLPARMETWGRPLPLSGRERSRAIARWRELDRCAGLARGPGRQTPRRHGAPCPLAPGDLRHLHVRHVGFDGRDHLGELVVDARYARDIRRVFATLYAARWPIRRMRPVAAYDGSDARSMAADNTSGFNCRRVAGTTHWSAHAYGAAIDLNPRENPYLSGSSVQPRSGRRLARLDRGPDSHVPPGVIRENDVVVRAFAAVGWTWGGTWAAPDYQHFTAPER